MAVCHLKKYLVCIQKIKCNYFFVGTAKLLIICNIQVPLLISLNIFITDLYLFCFPYHCDIYVFG